MRAPVPSHAAALVATALTTVALLGGCDQGSEVTVGSPDLSPVAEMTASEDTTAYVVFGPRVTDADSLEGSSAAAVSVPALAGSPTVATAPQPEVPVADAVEVDVESTPTTAWDGQYAGLAGLSVVTSVYDGQCTPDLELVVDGLAQPAITGSMVCQLEHHTSLSIGIEGEVEGSVASGVLIIGAQLVPWEGVFFHADRPFLSAAVAGETLDILGNPVLWEGRFAAGIGHPEANHTLALPEGVVPVPAIIDGVDGVEGNEGSEAPTDGDAASDLAPEPARIRTELHGLAFTSVITHVERIQGGITLTGRDITIDPGASPAAEDFGGLRFLPGSTYQATWDRLGWTVVVQGDVAGATWVQRNATVTFDSADGVSFTKGGPDGLGRR